jgi:hypothetical protein
MCWHEVSRPNDVLEPTVFAGGATGWRLGDAFAALRRSM